MIRRNLAWILFGLSLVLNVFFIGGFVYAKHYGPPWAPGHAPWQQRVDAKWAEELRLDDAQQRTFREAFRAMRQRNADRVRELMQVREKLAAELRKEQPDFAAIDPLLERSAALRVDMQRDGIRAAEQIAATLRPEQRAKFREVMAAKALGPGRRHGMRRPPPDERQPK
ncbi:Spy/CpxP family protein refolding chaperone [Reyranella sp. CPCC 100927]|uniref:Spy/CpxP family protein refolding chaperone n=1 Tax=Reyranella sp. CPCC 100927 TaxID=2599616 RepID=UPI0011B81D10|nr:periplasmic heavy metal sensor [Reyranella sp. CPCC 100927]TWT05628.1 periplasmic heavy metal sensor [Reyranella sp. CPCC 100927]